VTVYVDSAVIPWRGHLWAHLLGTDLDELHAFAAAIGLRRAWFQDAGRWPHYDVTAAKREDAIAAGAVAFFDRRIPPEVLMKRPDGRYVPRADVLRERAAARAGGG
jgi:hypothetical protein